MRLLIIPTLLVALLVQAPASALGNGNQELAERIADAIGERFPEATIDVGYLGGQVQLQGEAVSQDQKKRIIELVSRFPSVEEIVNENIQVVVPRAPTRLQAPVAKPVASPLNAPVPLPANASASRTNGNANVRAPMVATNARQEQQQPIPPPPQTPPGAVMAQYPQQQYPAAYGVNPGQPLPVHPRFAPNQHSMPIPMGAQPQQYTGQHQPAYHGQQGPLPGRYNQPNLPQHAWPAYANYPNYAQVSYPRMYSPKAWPYIGPFYPYPQVPLGWRKVTLEHHNGNWWLDFDDGTPSGPFSGLFRHPTQYQY